MNTPSLNHVAITVSDLEKSAEFYQNVLGLKLLEIRPEKSAMLGDGHVGLLGMLLSPNVLVSGIDHFGFTFLDSEFFRDYTQKIKSELSARGITYEEKAHHDKSRSLFFRDPNGYKLQLVYLPPDYFEIGRAHV